MSSAVQGAPVFTRRHWGREVWERVRYPLSMLESKHQKGRRLSQFRVVVLLMAIGFFQHWPAEWSNGSAFALAMILLAIPIGDLFARVPVAEALAALQVVFAAAGGKAIDKFREMAPAGLVSRTSTKVEEQVTVEPVQVPTPPVVIGDDSHTDDERG